MRNKVSLKLWIALTLLVLSVLPAASTLAETDWWPSHYVMVPYMLESMVTHNAAPDVPVLMWPADGHPEATATATSLNWVANDPDGHPLTYDIYIEASDPSPDTLVAQGLTSSDYTFQGWGQTTYYWQVIAKDPYGGVTAGPVWRFTTGVCDLALDLDVPTVVGQYITMEGQAVSPCANITQVDWDWGDGTTSQSAFPASHTYPEAQGYTVQVTASNDQGVSKNLSMDIYTGPPSGICDYVDQIPYGECQVLVALYEATGGENWNGISGWMVLTNPCVVEWEGVWCEDDRVSKLYLANMGLIGNVPYEIGWLSNLKEMQLQGNNLWSLPVDMQYLTKLEALDLRNNAYLTGPIPEGFANFTNMEYFAFSGTQMCVPYTGDIPAWMNSVDTVIGTPFLCP